MAIGNVELVHERFPKHLRMGIEEMKLGKVTDEEDKKKRVNIERSAGGTK